MKRIVAFIVALMSLSASAQTPSMTEKDGTFLDFDGAGLTLTSRVWSKYMGPTSGLVYYDKPVIQTDMFMSLKSGVYVDIWSSFGLDNSNLNGDYGDEIDLTAGFAKDVGKLSFDVGISYFALAPFEKVQRVEGRLGDIVQTYAEVRFAEYNLGHGNTIRPYARIDGYFEVNHCDGPQVYLGAGMYHRWQIDKNWSLNNQFSLMYDSGGFGVDSAFIARYKGTLAWKIAENVTWEVFNFQVYEPMTSTSDNRELELVYGTGFQFKLK